MSRAPAGATQARERAGYTLESAAALLHLTPARLRRKEQAGFFTLHQATRLAHFYRCPLEAFLPPPGRR